MTSLNDESAMRAMDPAGMSHHLERFPHHLVQAAGIGRDARIEVSPDGIRSVVILGMGGSAIGGELLSGLLWDELPVPLRVVRSYKLPGFVGPDTLVCASSYSGNTEETLSGYEQATRRGARILCVTSGGELRRLASARGHDLMTIPGGLPPRAALAYSLIPMLLAFWRIGLVDDPGSQIDNAVAVARDCVRRYGVDVPLDDNESKQIASWLADHIPVIYGSAPITSAVATRWSGQLSENAKTIAHANRLPEMNHNEIVGWSGQAPLAGRARVIVLRDADDDRAIAKRFDITRDEMMSAGCEVREVRSRGDTRLGRALSLVALGDYVSLYLAFLGDVDPTPVAPIDRLKEALSKRTDSSGE